MKTLKIIGSIVVVGIGTMIVSSNYKGPSNWGPYSYSNSAGGLVFGIVVVIIGLVLAIKIILSKYE